MDCLTEADLKVYYEGQTKRVDGKLQPMTDHILQMMRHFSKCASCEARYIAYYKAEWRKEYAEKPKGEKHG